MQITLLSYINTKLFENKKNLETFRNNIFLNT